MKSLPFCHMCIKKIHTNKLCFHELPCSNPIESVVEKEKRGSDLLCTACEMAVVWIQNQLRQNQTKELILQYVNQVSTTGYLCHTNIFMIVKWVQSVIDEVCFQCELQLCERLPSPNGESTVDCHQISKMPNLAFTIANKTFRLTPEQVKLLFSPNLR
jgi:phytepsin